jgi:hypothetical protein
MGKTSIIQDTYMSPTREHGRTTRVLEIGRHNGAHAEVREGRKKIKKASRNRRVVKTRPSHWIHLYVVATNEVQQIRKWVEREFMKKTMPQRAHQSRLESAETNKEKLSS